MFTRRTWPDPGGSNLSLDVQRSRGCGYECRVWGFLRILGVEPQGPTAFLNITTSSQRKFEVRFNLYIEGLNFPEPSKA